jgi:hypothetical protein
MSAIDAIVAFRGEVQLAGWSDSHTGGPKITLWLDDSAGLDIFRAMTTRKGNHSGQRFVAVLVEIGDDELPVAQPMGDACQQSVILCKSPQFQRYVAAVTRRPALSEPAAEEFVRSHCRIESRRELDSNPAALRLFRELLVVYESWRELEPA